MLCAQNMTIAPINKSLMEIPRNVEVRENRKATLYSIASTVSFVAFLAITGAALALTFGVSLPISTPLLVVLLMGTIPLQFVSYQFGMLAYAAKAKAHIARKKDEAFQLVQNWGNEEIKKFFEMHHLKLPLNQNQLLPLIGCYEYWKKEVETHFKAFQENLENQAPEPIRTEERRIGWRILEQKVLPAALNGALILQILQDSTRSPDLADLGICRVKEFDQRRFDQLFDGSDEYFVFNHTKRASLRFEELFPLIQDLDALRLKLFAIK